MTGAWLVFFWVIFMPITLITVGLIAGNKYLPPVWDKLFPAPPPTPTKQLKTKAEYHAEEHEAWAKVYRALLPPNDMDDQVVPWEPDDGETLISHHNGPSHRADMTCYNCERKNK